MRILPMDVQQHSDPAINSVPLLHAVLCADCEVISDSAGEVCAVCGSRSLLSLGRLLGGSVGGERAVLVGDTHKLFTMLLEREAS